MPKITFLKTKLLHNLFQPAEPWLICFWPATMKRLPTPDLCDVWFALPPPIKSLGNTYEWHPIGITWKVFSHYFVLHGLDS